MPRARILEIVYLLPLTYFVCTRLVQAHIAFHVLFEWGAAFLVVTLFGLHGLSSIWMAALVYLAFISVYEIGYLCNDLIATRYEPEPRLRGPQGASAWSLAAWISTRLMTFGAITVFLQMGTDASWWRFFACLALVLALHNLFTDKALKSASFFWLAWFRFVAPVVFLLEPSQTMGILLGGGMIYACFRLFGYLDSKGVLLLPQRREIGFRTCFFLLPGFAAVATAGYPQAAGFQVLVLYFAAVAFGGMVISKLAAFAVSR